MHAAAITKKIKAALLAIRLSIPFTPKTPPLGTEEAFVIYIIF